MNHEEFMHTRDDLNDHCTKLLAMKQNEYASGNKDRLNQFKRAAALSNCSPEKALAGMMIKHETSIHDMIDDISRDQHHCTECWKEKLGDLRNYCDLLWALLNDTGEI